MAQQTLINLIDLFLSVHSGNCVDKTAKWYREKLNAFAEFLKREGYPTDPKIITQEHFAAFFRYLREDLKRAQRTIRGYWIVLRCFFRWYCEESDLLDSVWRVERELKRFCPRVPKKVCDALTQDEVKSLLSVITDRRDYCIIALLIGTGIRAGELINLDVEDVDMKRGRIFIRHAGYRSPARTKLNCERFVPLQRSLKAVLADYMARFRPHLVPEDCSLFFAKPNGKALTIYGLHRLVRRWLERAGIKKSQSGPQLLRRTFATLARAAGMDKLDLAALLGHSEAIGTRVLDESYLAGEANEQALGRVSDVLKDVLPPQRGRKR